MGPTRARGRPPSLGTRILAGLVLGTACGLCFGELTRPLKPVGDVFVGLLQMTVLPYIVVALIANVGRLSLDRASRLAAQIAADHFDVAMSGLVGTVERSQQMRLSEPYLDATFSLVVRDHRARDVDSYEEFAELDSFRVGVLMDSQFSDVLRFLAPRAETTVVESTQWFFEEPHDLDALILSAEAGAALTILYPGFQVVVPGRRTISMPLVYAIARGDEEFGDFLDFWVSFRKGMGDVSRLYDYRIRGVGPDRRVPRWSVLRDVLGWPSRPARTPGASRG